MFDYYLMGTCDITAFKQVCAVLCLHGSFAKILSCSSCVLPFFNCLFCCCALHTSARAHILRIISHIMPSDLLQFKTNLNLQIFRSWFDFIKSETTRTKGSECSLETQKQCSYTSMPWAGARNRISLSLSSSTYVCIYYSIDSVGDGKVLSISLL